LIADVLSRCLSISCRDKKWLRGINAGRRFDKGFEGSMQEEDGYRIAVLREVESLCGGKDVTILFEVVVTNLQ
jgi:hypothetical protein